MMKRIAAAAAGVMVVAGLAVAEQTDVSGTWNFVVNLDAGSGEPVFVFMQDGEILTGSYEGTFGSASVTGTVMGDRIEFTFGAEGAGQATYTGQITAGAEGMTMEGSCDYGDVGGGSWSATKAN